ncbi:sensor histidine kinase [Aeromicrobium sp. Leaf350]|uniref:sensor histidine kinase n=1 Tax=Aeromicrobium sp. Leaf350 TaxID=2876565 RepID=UPI001E5036EF|nr:histidine kinase [Aeromicrobium sp. Leaf350]
MRQLLPSDRQPVFSPLPISRWGHTWRILLVIVLAAASWIEAGIWQWQNLRWWFWVDLAIGVAMTVVALGRRRHPLTVALVTNAATFISFSSGGAATLALFSLATRRRWREIVPAGLVGLGAGLVSLRSAPGSQEDDFIVTGPALVAILGIIIAWGMYVGSRRELLGTLRERAETAESEQAARVAQARTGERTRIAREMHDVLAHRISTVTMHAGALTYREDLTPAQMRETAGVIQQNAHQALVELREVLGLLREGPGDAAPERPQPDATAVHDLITEAQSTGLRVEASIDIDTGAVPQATGRTVYRVVQEGLTNVRKHATHTAAEISITGAPGEGLKVVVRNKLPIGQPVNALPPSGLGLIGLRERVELAGGRLERHVTPRRDFVLSAWIPWPA